MTQRQLTDEEVQVVNAVRAALACIYTWDYSLMIGSLARLETSVVEMLRHGTTDGQPWVDPAPPIPTDYRLAVAGDEGRRDCKQWKGSGYVDRWESNHLTGESHFVEGNYYIVPVDRTPTDEDASLLPHVKVRDYDDRPWEKKVLVRVASTGLFHCLGLSRRNLESWSRCRHLYRDE